MKVRVLLLLTIMTVPAITVKPNENNTGIMRDKYLVVAIDTCGYNYFLQKGNPCGYQLELFEMFARDERRTLDVRIANGDAIFDLLKEGEIDVAVFSKGFDSLYSVFNKYSNICSTIPLDDNVKSVWIADERNMPLVFEINAWASRLKGQSIYNFLQAKYFRNNPAKSIDQITPYDKLLRKYSAKAGWDWRLAASVMYHESRFRTAAVSRAGAIGLMQLMPNTVKKFGVRNVYDPEENIKGGMRLIAYLTDVFREKGIEGEELTRFVLAAYNAGHGKVFRFMKDTEDLGLDPHKWSNVYSVILLKSGNAHVNSSKKFSGKETLMFVENVMKNYYHYRNLMS